MQHESENHSVVYDSLRPHRLTVQFMEFSRPGDLPNPEIKPRSPTLQADSLPAEPQGKPNDNFSIRKCSNVIHCIKRII